MAKTKVSEYDATAANNTDIDSINIAEGMAPSNVNNAIRQLMAHLKTEFFKTGTGNTSLGDAALDSLDGSSPGGSNVAIGKDAGTALTTGANNVAVGHSALKTEDANSGNTAIGYQSLEDLNAGADSYNTAVGYISGTDITTGIRNTIIGAFSGDDLTDADYNVTLGFGALGSDTKGNKTVAIGVDALTAQNHTSSTDTNNVAVGYNAGAAVTTATRNTVVGSSAGASNQTSLYNTYVGYGAGESTTGQGNTFIGDASGNSVVAGEFNTLLGQQAGNAITSGDKNTVIGRYNGNQNSLDIRTSSNNILLSDGAGNPQFWINSNGAVSATANGVTHPTGTQSYHMFQNSAAATYTLMARNGSASPGAHYMSELNFTGAAPNNTTAKFLQCRDTGGARLDIESNGDVKNANNTYGAISDEKLKENIVDSGSQWADIKAVKVRKYSFKADELDAANKIGVIAQELEASGMNGLVDTQKDIDLETREDLGTETKSVKYSVLYMKAIKALQEAMTRIETLETKVAALEAE